MIQIDVRINVLKINKNLCFNGKEKTNGTKPLYVSLVCYKNTRDNSCHFNTYQKLSKEQKINFPDMKNIFIGKGYFNLFDPMLPTGHTMEKPSFDDTITFSIDIRKIKANRLLTIGKDKYYDFVLIETKRNEYDNNFIVKEMPTNKEKEAGTQTEIIGNGRTWADPVSKQEKSQPLQNINLEELSEEEIDNLPLMVDDLPF